MEIKVSEFFKTLKNNRTRIQEIITSFRNNEIADNIKKELEDEYMNLLISNKRIFEIVTNRVEGYVDEMLNSLVMGQVSDINDSLKELNEDVEIISGMAREILVSLDELKNNFNDSAFDMKPSEIRNTIKRIREKLRNLKQQQIDKYNERVLFINSRIQDLKKLGMDDVTISNEIDVLEELSLCNIKISQYNQNNYLKMLDYNKLKEVSLKIEEITQKKLNYKMDPLAMEIIFKINYLIDKMIGFGESINRNNITNGEMNLILLDIMDFKREIDVFKIYLLDNKSKISEDLYNNCLDRVKSILEDLGKLDRYFKNNRQLSSYEDIDENVSYLSLEVTNYIFYIDSICSFKITSEIASIFNKKLDSYLLRIKELDEIVSKFNFRELNQKSSLDIRLRAIEAIINNSKSKVNNSVRNVIDVSEIDDIDKEIQELSELLVKSELVIKDKDRRVLIQNKINSIDSKIKLLEGVARVDNNINKKINEYKKRMDVITLDYRKRCPLGIKQIKDGSHVMKKHNKLVLISSGLAITALSMSTTVGKILVPAIILGNVLLADKHPVLDKINDILGKVIGAKKNDDGTWKLANGIVINASSAITAFLKSLAVCNIPNFVGSMINKVKELSSKIALKDRFKKLEEHFKGSMEVLRLDNLYYSFKASGLELDEFLKELTISKEEKDKFVDYVNYKNTSNERVNSYGR